ncbi:MAG TPA: carbon storage regulator CsrA [Sulfuricurvum sp.]|jgi:carbon storage regulator|nr:MAG: carbon storage regulator [Campylobacterales bacterium 16-40-21]OZA02987.1 MAG: carbon storage regulator [Sulfuricurvum sp. 17-40-25]HQS66930.1 carbon storage regulator CsrA [Sulfuricurvum sp.]HQT35668.1 carbon storage regulator CsrA [Sulfuricurvum sp.]
MLILSRKLDESILIGDSITLKVISIDKGSVKLGIDAPLNVRVLRSELINAVKDSNQAASTQQDDSLLRQLAQKFKL